MEIGDSKKILQWEKWRIKYGVAKDKLVFFNEGFLFIILAIGSIVISIIRLLHINNNIYLYIRIWLFLYPLPIAFYLTIIMIFVKKLKRYGERDLDKIVSTEKEESGRKYIFMGSLFFAASYISAIILLLLFIPFSFFSYDENKVDLQNRMIAHRGLHDEECPENTLSAFQNAINQNYAVELDIWISKDNIPVVIHDNDMKRLCGTDQKITGLSVEEIKKMRVVGKAEIPTLQEVLGLVDGQVPLIAEIKKYFPAANENQALADVLKEYEGIYMVQSFSPVPLCWFKQNYPAIPRGQLLADWKSFSNRRVFCLRDNIYNMISEPDYIGYDRNVIKYASLNGIRKHEIPVISWLFNIDEIKEEDEHGYDGYLIEKTGKKSG